MFGYFISKLSVILWIVFSASQNETAVQNALAKMMDAIRNGIINGNLLPSDSGISGIDEEDFDREPPKKACLVGEIAKGDQCGRQL